MSSLSHSTSPSHSLSHSTSPSHSLSTYVFISISLPPSVHLSLCLCLSLCLYLSVSLSLYLSLYLSLSVSVSLSLCLSVSVSFSLSLSLSLSVQNLPKTQSNPGSCFIFGNQFEFIQVSLTGPQTTVVQNQIQFQLVCVLCLSVFQACLSLTPDCPFLSCLLQLAPENTLMSFNKALQQSVSALEADVAIRQSNHGL